ncbi:unnamed protein product [Calicophoron daubneyi]|uniref:Thioesterase domain-containing protein n=1 Tax=Calicophoron daubneyi TaxID=300641 RepID=A0AAV2TAW9_CALDB
MSITQTARIFKLLCGDLSFNRMCNIVQVVSATDKCLSCRFQVKPSEGNSLGSLHGGFIATATDIISSVDLMRLGHPKHFVKFIPPSRYLRPAAFESWIQVDSYVLYKGNRLAFCDVIFTDESSGKIMARGSHTKFILKE